MKKCGNCKNRCVEIWGRLDYCLGYEMAESEKEEIDLSTSCPIYEEGTPDCLVAHLLQAAIYSPSNPWDAPGMSIRDFI